MNIFALDIDPVQAAQAHCDAHVVKMILETAQILSAVWHKSGLTTPESCYKLTHKSHPCVLWAEKCEANYTWLVELGKALASEYTIRYQKVHKSQHVLYALADAPNNLPQKNLTPFALAMPDDIKHKCPITAYRNYYCHKRKVMHRFSYTNRNQPNWLKPTYNMLTNTKSILSKETNKATTNNRSKFPASAKIYKAQNKNPRREGCKGYETWEIIKDGMTIAEFIEAGGERIHLMYDYGRGAVDITK